MSEFHSAEWRADRWVVRRGRRWAEKWVAQSAVSMELQRVVK